MRERREWERTAWQTMALLNIQLPRDKKIKSIEELIGKEKKPGVKPKSKAEYDEDFKNILKRTENAVKRK